MAKRTDKRQTLKHVVMATISIGRVVMETIDRLGKH